MSQLDYTFFPLSSFDLTPPTPQSEDTPGWQLTLSKVLHEYWGLPHTASATEGYSNLAITLSNMGYGSQQKASQHTLLSAKHLYHDMVDFFGEPIMAKIFGGEKGLCMKNSVCAHIQALCEKDLPFARLTMHPRKSMLHCIQYIFRHAQDYLKKELAAGGIKVSGNYGGDVPDGLCFQWAEDYFRDPDTMEDQEPESKFTPRPYIKPYTPKPAEPKPAPKPKGFVVGQINLLGEAS